MTACELMEKRRSIRKFTDKPVPHDELVSMVNCARLAPSAANLQPIKYAIIEGENAKKMFPHTAWAGYSGGRETPSEAEQPTAYILILADTEISKKGYELDAGAAAMSIILAAEEHGIASCWLASIARNELASLFSIDEKFVINSAIALGYPADKSDVTEFKDSVKYFRTEDGRFLVPKRSLESVIVNI